MKTKPKSHRKPAARTQPRSQQRVDSPFRAAPLPNEDKEIIAIHGNALTVSVGYPHQLRMIEHAIVAWTYTADLVNFARRAIDPSSATRLSEGQK